MSRCLTILLRPSRTTVRKTVQSARQMVLLYKTSCKRVGLTLVSLKTKKKKTNTGKLFVILHVLVFGSLSRYASASPLIGRITHISGRLFVKHKLRLLEHSVRRDSKVTLVRLGQDELWSLQKFVIPDSPVLTTMGQSEPLLSEKVQKSTFCLSWMTCTVSYRNETTWSVGSTWRRAHFPTRNHPVLWQLWLRLVSVFGSFGGTVPSHLFWLAVDLLHWCKDLLH